MLKRTAIIGICLSASLSTLAAVRAQQKESKLPALTALDYFEIQQLVNRYAFAIDTCSNNGYDYADLYTSDGVFYWGVGARNRSAVNSWRKRPEAGKTAARSSARHPGKADRHTRDGESGHRAVARRRHRKIVSGVSRRAWNRCRSRSLRTRGRIPGRLRENRARLAFQIAAARLSAARPGYGQALRRGTPGAAVSIAVCRGTP